MTEPDKKGSTALMILAALFGVFAWSAGTKLKGKSERLRRAELDVYRKIVATSAKRRR